MSASLISQVWKKELGRPEKSIMLILADHANDDGTHVSPSIAQIAWKTGYSERQVRRIMKRLRDQGVLVTMEEANYRQPTEYRIDLSVLSSRPDIEVGV